MFAPGAVPGHRRKMVLCADTEYPICWSVQIQQTEHMSTAFKVRESHHACVPCSIYPLDCCFLRFLYLFHVVFYMKHLRDQMDYDDRRRLARIVTETCAAISRRLKVLFCFVQVVS